MRNKKGELHEAKYMSDYVGDHKDSMKYEKMTGTGELYYMVFLSNVNNSRNEALSIWR